jgi:hypothetical protein
MIRSAMTISNVRMTMREWPYSSLQELHEERLEKYKQAFDAGQPLAAPAAMDYCNRYEIVPPSWVLVESHKIQCALLNEGTPKRFGRANGVISRHKQNMIDSARHSTVENVHENRDYLDREIATLRKLKGPAARNHLLECEKLRRWAGTNDRGAFACASMMLRGTYAFGGPDAIRISYRRVERNLRSKSTAMQYYELGPQFLHKIGLNLSLVKEIKKVVPLFDLTT